MSVLGLSSPGNLIIGEGAAFVAFQATNCSKNTLTITRRQLNIVGKPIFRVLCEIFAVNRVVSSLPCSLFTPSASQLRILCRILFFFLHSLTGHPAPRLDELSQFVLAYALFPQTFSAQAPCAGEPTVGVEYNSMFTHTSDSLSAVCAKLERLRGELWMKNGQCDKTTTSYGSLCYCVLCKAEISGHD